MKIIDYQLEKAHLDWSDLHTQMVIGMSAIFFLCLDNFAPITRLCLAGLDMQGISAPVCCPLSGGLQIITFFVYFGSCLLTALITLQITGRFGNRIGASCSLWSALLFSILNGSAGFCSAASITARISSFFIMLAIVLFLREKNNKKLLSWFFLGLFCFCIYLNNSFGYSFSFLPFIQMFFRDGISSIDQNEAYLFAVMCSLAAANLLVRIALRSLDFEAIGISFGCILMAIILANLKILDYSFGQQRTVIAFDSPSMLLARAAFVIGLSLWCLPGIDSLSIKAGRITGFLGIIALISLAAIFEKLFTT